MKYLLVLSCVLSQACFAEVEWKGTQGWGKQSEYVKLFNPSVLENMTGKVLRVESLTPVPGMSPGIFITIKNGKEEIPVQLGPNWFIENQDFKIAPNDVLKITGSRVLFQGKPMIVATEIKKDEKIVHLRNKSGMPVWNSLR